MDMVRNSQQIMSPNVEQINIYGKTQIGWNNLGVGESCHE